MVILWVATSAILHKLVNVALENNSILNKNHNQYKETEDYKISWLTDRGLYEPSDYYFGGSS